jgi:hypothetical protein
MWPLPLQSNYLASTVTVHISRRYMCHVSSGGATYRGTASATRPVGWLKYRVLLHRAALPR